ncbi:MAG: serine/threonine protein kinase, partial [Planctomycetes bacterium]|nr:serine/threonine protein kinase [Planctomycetota bacterium]
MAKRFGKYEVLEEIARGAMGIVYKARHPALEKTVALKALMEAHESSKEQVERFQAEAKAAAKLRHPNIVPVHDVGISNGVLYFTMDFIEGTTLKDLIERRSLSARAAAELLAKVARALHYAHGQGIIHRDVKPANVLIDREGLPYVTDFGLAVDAAAAARAQGKKAATAGTPEYMSPEQAAGRADADLRTDVYSLGATLYKALTGRPVFSGPHLLAVLSRIRFDEPKPPSRWEASVPRDLETICLKCLEK